MPRKKHHRQASEFQRLARQLEKALGLGGEKTHRFIEGLSKNLSPLLDELEICALQARSLPIDRLRKICENYMKEFIRGADLSWSEFSGVSAKMLGLMKNWVRPDRMLAVTANIARFYLGRSEEEITDPFGRDPELVEALRPLFEFLYKDYWRVKVVGASNVPKTGKVLLVANHSGGLPYDGSMITLSLKRDLRFLIDDFVFGLPFLGTFMNRLGAVQGSPENAIRLLKQGKAVLVFPEGAAGLGKLYEERYRLQRFGRGFVRIAIETGTPIVPVSVIGAEEIHPMIWKSNILSRALGLPYLPVTPTFPWFGPLGLIPFPTQWKIHFGKPVSFPRAKSSQAGDEALLQQLSDRVRDKIQKQLDDDLKKRKSVWAG